VTGTITLNSGGLPINNNITILGPGPNQLSVDGSQALLVFGVFPQKAAAMSGLTVMNGQIGIWNEQGTPSAMRHSRATPPVLTTRPSGMLRSPTSQLAVPTSQ
jgi:hypothetical protein